MRVGLSRKIAVSSDNGRCCPDMHILQASFPTVAACKVHELLQMAAACFVQCMRAIASWLRVMRRAMYSWIMRSSYECTPLMRVTWMPTPANTDFQPVTRLVRTTECDGANLSSALSGDPRGDMIS